VPLAVILPALVATGASAEERCKFGWDASAAETKFPQ
jgi:hypothetical protein